MSYIPKQGKVLTKEEIKQIIKEQNVVSLRLQFVDINGNVKNLCVPISQLDKALNNECMLDGSSIQGFRSIETSDMYFYPDLSTFAILPWRERGDKNEARIICDIHNADGTPFEGCPRCNLKRVIKEAKDLGYTLNVGPEVEFFMFKKDEKGNTTLEPSDNAYYYDAAPKDEGEDVRADMVETLQSMGFNIEASHHEGAAGQHEIDFKYDEALVAADNVVTLKHVISEIAMEYGLHASFMPKPIYGINGSGMHCNVSLFKDGKNVFDAPDAEYGLSDEAKWTIGALLDNVESFTAITNPLVNSYKRLVPGYEAPVYIAWSLANRSALIRVPAKRGNATRVELRSPDPSCNPYLVFATMLTIMLEGIKNQTPLRAPIEDNIYEMSKKEKAEKGIKSLPGSLNEALYIMKKSEVVKLALGEHILNEFLSSKTQEWNEYRTDVSGWEIKKYL